jgi:Histidine kinase-, DNA gyrase B-, and HSP90-like ATPase
VGNLLQNAFKFTRPRTTVTVRVCADAERVRIEIEDECGGIPGENLDERSARSSSEPPIGPAWAWASPSAERAPKRTVAGFMRATDSIPDAS